MGKDYFKGRGFNGYAGENHVSPGRGRVNSNKNAGAFMESNRVIETAVEDRDMAYDSAAKAIASYVIVSNKDGVSDKKGITEELGKLLRNFSAEERAMILTSAMTYVIVNI